MPIKPAFGFLSYRRLIGAEPLGQVRTPVPVEPGVDEQRGTSPDQEEHRYQDSNLSHAGRSSWHPSPLHPRVRVADDVG